MTLPAGEFDAENFTEAASLWRSRSGLRLAAAREARRTRFLGPQARFLDAGVVTRDSAAASGGAPNCIGLNAFVRFVHEPEKWVEKAVGIVRVQKDEDLAVSVQGQNDNLSKHRRKTCFLERLRAAENPDDERVALIADLERDPLNGVAGLRAANVMKELNSAAALAVCERELMRGRQPAGDLPAGVVRLAGAAPFEGVECGPVPLWKGDSDIPTIVETELSGRDALRGWLRHLVRSMAHRPGSVCFATTSIYDKDGAAAVRRYAPIEPGSAQHQAAAEIVAGILKMLNRQAAAPMAAADEPPKSLANGPTVSFAGIWLGCGDAKTELVPAACRLMAALSGARELFEARDGKPAQEPEAGDDMKHRKKKTSKSKRPEATLESAMEELREAFAAWDAASRAVRAKNAKEDF